MSSPYRVCALIGLLAIGGVAPLRAQPPAKPQPSPSTVATVAVTGPTVVAFFVVRAGQVDTMPDLAVAADDWNYSMATLGDSLRAHGIRLALVTQPILRLTSRGESPTSIRLTRPPATGYGFVRPGARACIQFGAATIDSVIATARRYFGPGAPQCNRGKDIDKRRFST